MMSLCLILALCVDAKAQSSFELEKIPLMNGLQKVKSGQFYGVYDANDRVLVSVEYADFVFVDNIAILTKDDGTVHGYVRDNGEVMMFDEVYEFHPRFPFYWNGFLPVRKIPKTEVFGKDNQSTDGKWMFVNEFGNPIYNPSFKKVKIPTPYTFFRVNTFSDGYAVVTTKQNKRIHINKKGETSFILPKEEECFFRSSVHEGRCVMLTSTGIKVYQENPSTREAIVERVLLPYTASLDTSNLPSSLSFTDGSLHFDLWGRAVKFVSKDGEELYFIGEAPVKEEEVLVEEVVDTLDLSNDIEAKLKNTVATASERGYAAYALQVKNNSETCVADSINVTVKSSGMKDKSQVMVLEPGASGSITFYLPARFSEEQQKRKVTVTVADENNVVEHEFTVTAKRYIPEDF